MAETITIARPYAKAVFENARQNSSIPEWSETLATLAAVSDNDEAETLLQHPGVTAAEKASLVVELSGGKLSESAQNFVHTLAENKRLTLLKDIQSLFEHYRSQLESTVDVSVETAFEIDEGLQQKLAGALQQKLDRKVTLQTTLNKALIGGVIVRAGDTVIDASVRGKLAKLVEAVSS